MCQKIAAVLKQESVPFILTLLIGVLAWGITSLVDNAKSIPVVKWDADAGVVPGKPYKIKLTNLSGNENFANTVFKIFSIDENFKITSAASIPHFPNLPAEASINASQTEAEYKIGILMPSSSITLQAQFEGKGEPLFGIKSAAKGFQLMKPNSQTLLIEYETWFIVVLTLVLPIVLIIRSVSN